jgi:SHS2 domain-containing protein
MHHNKEYELVPHTADLKMYAYGTTFEELFRNALRGMFASIKPQSKLITYEHDVPHIAKYSSERHVVVRSTDREALLIDFLSDCLYLADTQNEAYFDARFKELSETELDATIFGVEVTGFEVVEIKAVTYHDLQLELIDGQWRATLVFDI